jgi:hypothetical protein
MNEDKNLSRGSGDFHNRRRQADWVVKGAVVLSIISWAVAIAALLVIEFASPDNPDLMSRTFGGVVDSTWNDALLPIAFILLVASVCVCIIAFVFNMMRMRRKTDKYRKSIIIIGALSFIGLITLSINFAPYLFG